MLTKYPSKRVSKNRASGDVGKDGAEPAFRALIRTFGLIRRVMEPYFGKFGISGSQWGVLRALNCAAKDGGESLRLSDLSEKLLIQPPSVTGVVDRLERLSL